MATASLPDIHFFRPGTHQPMVGAPLTFSAADLAASAAAYDPALYPAPIVVGHPQIDAPAYGWVGAIRAETDGLYAVPDQVEAQFAEMVGEGRFKRVSASWFTPNHPRNPVPGVYYLRHLGFLGAAAPGVPGLKPVQFGDDDDCLVMEFAYDDQVNAGLWRNLREWLLAKFGAADADQVVPRYDVSTLEAEAAEEAAPAAITPGFAESGEPAANPPQPPFDKEGGESQPEEPTVTPEQAAALEAENQRLAAELATAKAQAAEAGRLQLHADHAAFAETQVQAGRMSPGLAPVMVSVLDHLAGSEPPAFGEGDEAQPLVQALKTALAAAPKVIEFAEVGAPEDEAAATAAFAAPDGYQVDAAALDLHRRALAHQAAHKTDYLAAVRAVSQP